MTDIFIILAYACLGITIISLVYFAMRTHHNRKQQKREVTTAPFVSTTPLQVFEERRKERRVRAEEREKRIEEELRRKQEHAALQRQLSQRLADKRTHADRGAPGRPGTNFHIPSLYGMAELAQPKTSAVRGNVSSSRKKNDTASSSSSSDFGFGSLGGSGYSDSSSSYGSSSSSSSSDSYGGFDGGSSGGGGASGEW